MCKSRKVEECLELNSDAMTSTNIDVPFIEKVMEPLGHSIFFLLIFFRSTNALLGDESDRDHRTARTSQISILP